MRTLLAFLVFVVLTLVCGLSVIVARVFGVAERAGSVYEWAPRLWARGILWASGVHVTLHGAERIDDGEPHIFVSNHVSWYDVLALATVLPPYAFVAKAELFRVPVFGPAARAIGTIPIQRENRKAAFQSYDEAAKRIRNGRSVVVYPEGTRGTSYTLRPFKKGPFVLAIASGVPIVPTIIHGTIERLPRGSLWARAGHVDVHLLDPVPTAGLTYEDRDPLARAVYDRMADAMRSRYGVDSPPWREASPAAPRPADDAAPAVPTSA